MCPEVFTSPPKSVSRTCREDTGTLFRPNRQRLLSRSHTARHNRPEVGKLFKQLGDHLNGVELDEFKGVVAVAVVGGVFDRNEGVFKRRHLGLVR